MALTDFIFRYISKAGYTTKGSDLTWTELDENFEILIDELANNRSEAVGNVTPYNPATTYTNTNPVYVSYNGNIYEYIFAGSSAGQTPDTSPSYWSLVSNGKLTHQQNTDTYLALGTANQVSASELKSLLADTYITGTRATIIGLRDSSQLKIGRLYYISDERISLQAVSVNTLSTQGLYIGYNADYQNASTQMLQASTNDCIWGSNSSIWWTDILATYPTTGSRIGKHCIYKGKHYVSITGNNSATTPDADATNWLLATSGSATYQREVDSVIYDIDLNLIMERKDKRNNIVTRSSNAYTNGLEVNFQFGNDNVHHNVVTASTEIYSSRANFSYNVCIGSSVFYVYQDESGCGMGVTFNTLANSFLWIEAGGVSAYIINNSLVSSYVKFIAPTDFGGVSTCVFNKVTSGTMWTGLDTPLTRCTFMNFDNADLSHSTLGNPYIDCVFDGSIDTSNTAQLNNVVLRNTKSGMDIATTMEDSDVSIDVKYRDLTLLTINGSGTATIVDIVSSQYHKMLKIQPKNPSILIVDTMVGNIVSEDGSVLTYTLDGANGDYIVGVYMADDTFQITNAIIL